MSATEKMRAQARLLAGGAPDADPDDLSRGNGALPPGVEGGLDAQTVYRD